MGSGMPAFAQLAFVSEVVLIPAGPFLMGSDPRKDKHAHPRETPQHLLYLPDFSLGKTPVTNAQYAAFVEETGQRAPDHWDDGRFQADKSNDPVVHVSWHDAVAFCRWLSEVTGEPYRLPSEAEWEKAASWEQHRPKTDEIPQPADEGRQTKNIGATTGTKRRYPWGDEFDASRCNTKESGIGDITSVGAFPWGTSPYGLLDMAGNVYEWTISLWGTDMKEPAFGYPYDPSDGREDLEAGNGILRILRGGAFYYDAFYARAAHRVKSYPDYRVRTRGFRVCLDNHSQRLGSPQGKPT
jgi:formylglycine-generating enzyme required for sulfatase activity